MEQEFIHPYEIQDMAIRDAERKGYNAGVQAERTKSQDLITQLTESNSALLEAKTELEKQVSELLEERREGRTDEGEPHEPCRRHRETPDHCLRIGAR